MSNAASATPPEGLDRTAVVQALRAGATVLTPNRRLARALKAEFDRAQLQSGLRVWPSAEVLPWDTWLLGALEQAADGQPQMLSPLQEMVLWREVIAASAIGAQLLSETTVRTAQDAWRRLHQYALDDRLRDLGAHADQRVFREWALDLMRRLDALGAVTQSQGAALLRRRVELGWRPLAPLVLAGFDHLTPRQLALLDALRAAGVAIEQPRVPLTPRRAQAIACVDARDQWRLAAGWARARLSADPQARIGIVVPDLQAQRSALTRALDEALVPARVIEPDDETARPFNLSLGEPLARAPLVAAALNLLTLLVAPQPLSQAGALLRSPFLGEAEREAARRARLDRALRDQSVAQLDLARLRRLAGRSDAQGAPQGDAAPLLAARLARALARRDTWRRAPPSQWAERFCGALADLGFPGERPLNSPEFQTHQRLRDLFASLATLDRLLGSLALSDAVAMVRRLANDIVFQPEAPAVPVQVLGVLEAQQLQFDALWVGQMTDAHWPAAPDPNPLLPLVWQRAAGMPGASAELALAQAARTLQRWAGTAGELVLSHPQAEDDRVLAPSALLRGVEYLDAARLGIQAAAPLALALRTGSALEATIDSSGPPLPSTAAGAPALAVGGGTRLLTDLAACAFRAFAAHRLRARELPEPEAGLSAADRGRLLHATMAHLWHGLRSHQALRAAAGEELERCARAAADLAVGELREARPDLLASRTLELESRRLLRTALAWLDLERQRPPFEVLAIEQPIVVHLHDVRLDVKPDRIDRLPDGTVLIIDYKSRAPGVNAWLGERPDEPQLPLYAVHLAQDVAGIAFAQLQPGRYEFRAVLAPGVVLPGVRGEPRHPAGWPGLLHDWRLELERLLRTYLAGVAEVAPKRETSCEFCPQPVLCRLAQRRGEAERLGDAGGATEDATAGD